jgi:hypothetical protein
LAATDLAAITGMVFQDTTGNGYDPGEELADVTIELYRDDNDGSFEPGTDDLLEDTTTTDGNGNYRFEDLVAGSYFVRQPPQTVGSESLDEDVSPPIVITTTDAAGIFGTSFDGFTTVQLATASFLAGTTADSSVAAPEALGGERDLFVELTAAAVDFDEVSMFTVGGLLNLRATVTATGRYITTWDGPDGDGTTTDFTGLGSQDLTDGGASNHIAMIAGVDQPNGVAIIRIYTDDTRWSEATIPLVDTGGPATEEYFLSYANDFAPGGGAIGGADFADVGAIQLEVVGNELATDGQISLIGTIGPTVFTQDFDNVLMEMPVDIDIKPGNYPNAVNTKSNGVVPVAILGSRDFNVTLVAPDTLRFGPNGAAPKRQDHLEDVNDDGFTDLVAHFRQKLTGIRPGDTEACLTGELNDGTRFVGTDSVFTTPSSARHAALVDAALTDDDDRADATDALYDQLLLFLA